MKVIKEKNKTTYVVFLLDDSVSMQSIRKPTISGFNEQLEVVKLWQQPDHDVFVSFAKFSMPGSFEVIRKWVKAKELEPITELDYQAKGSSTALLDSMQATINLAQEKEKEILKDKNAGLVIFFTDGEENSSVEVKDGQTIKNQIEALRETKHWTFTFTGTQEAAVVEKQFGISMGNTTTFTGGVAGMAAYTNSTSDGLTGYGSSRLLGDTYTDTFYNNTDEDKKKVDDKA